jgi:hypothetical protein
MRAEIEELVHAAFSKAEANTYHGNSAANAGIEEKLVADILNVFSGVVIKQTDIPQKATPRCLTINDQNRRCVLPAGHVDTYEHEFVKVGNLSTNKPLPY